MSEIVLDVLSKRDFVESLQLSDEFSVDHQKIVGYIKSLQSLGEVIDVEQTSSVRWSLTAEGEEIARLGSHEAVLFNHVPPQGISQKELIDILGAEKYKVGFSKAMSLNMISVDKKAEGGPRVFRKDKEIIDLVQIICQKVRDRKLDEVAPNEKTDCKKRKLITESKIVSYIVRKGLQFTTTIQKPETEITQDMLISGSWKSKQFKPYNFNAKGLDPQGGHLHTLLKVRTQFRQIFLEMGFSEMPTNNFVESSFWNFDALFQPQQHPARDAHDTFFLSDPAEANSFPMDYLEKVKAVHSVGGYGSQGHKCDWKLKEAAKNIMRTHTTGVSARMLYQLAKQPTFVPSKFFSIDRVFRNETLDATHLAEFHQIEGLVADYGLTLGDLMGYIQEFFKKYGIEKLKFKPAFNPYTEPSMEIFSYHEGLKKWVEIGNSGMFRPEMLLPMGLPKGVSVIAWGLSLERPTMIKYGFSNIRDLFGPRVDLQKIYDNPICRLGNSDNTRLVTKFPEKENSDQPCSDLLLLDKRMERLLLRLKNLRSKVDGHLLVSDPSMCVVKIEKPLPIPALSKCPVTTTSFMPVENLRKNHKVLAVDSAQATGKSVDCQFQKQEILLMDPLPTLRLKCVGGSSESIVISCDPCNPPVSLFLLLGLLKFLKTIHVVSLVHSSLRLSSEQLEKLKRIFPSGDDDQASISKRVTIIWKNLEGLTDAALSVGLNTNIRGERNIARYLFNMVEAKLVGNGIGGEIGNPNDDVFSAVSDDLIECVDSDVLVTKLCSVLKASSGPLLFGSLVSLADIIAWSRLVKSKNKVKLAMKDVQQWFDHCSQLPYFSAVLGMLN